MHPATITDRPDGSSGWTLAYGLCQILGWSAYVAVGLSMVLPQTGPQPVVIGGYVAYFFYSIALTHGLRALIRRRQWLSLSPGRAALRLLIAAVAVGTIQASLVILVQAVWTRTSPFAAGTGRFFLLMASNSIAASLVWTALYTGIGSLHRARRARLNAIALEQGMHEARLKALEAQLSPHFLFNCLNSLRGMIGENPPRAQDMVTSLANILRHNLVRSAETSEPLADQLDIVTDYLALESIRLEERLRTRLDIDPATRTRLAPSMLLQTLVENAIKHGIAHLPDGGEILVQSRLRDDGSLELIVENSGTLGPSPTGSTHVGLANARERLRLLHGPTATLELTAVGPDRVRATARIPSSA